MSWNRAVWVLLLCLVAMLLLTSCATEPKVVPSTPKPEGCYPYGPDARGYVWMCGLV